MNYEAMNIEKVDKANMGWSKFGSN